MDIVKINIGKDLYLKGRIGWKGLSKDEYLKESNHRIINGTALEDNFIDWDKCGYITKERYDESPEIQLLTEDILISKDGTLGKIGYVKKLEKPSTVASGIFVLRNICNNKLVTDYLYHFLKSKIFKNFINRNKAPGSTILHLYQRDLSELEIQLPSIQVQTSIANFLNALDYQIEINNRINSELESIAKLIYNYWFVQFDFPDENGKPYKTSGGKMVWNEKVKREIPYGWGTIEIGRILGKELHKNKILASDISTQGLYPVIDQSTDFIAGFTNESGAVINAKEPKIIFGDHTRILKFINFDFARGADGTQVLFSKETRMPQHLFYHTLLKIDLSNYGYARHFKFLKDIAIILPDNIVAKKYEYLISNNYQLIRDNIFQNLKLAELRDWLLPMLMNGQVKVK